MFNQGSLKELDDYKNKLSEVFQYITDFNASKRTQQAQSILNIDVSEYEKAVSIYEDLLKKDSAFTESAAKKQAISEAFKDASDSLKNYAAANDLTSESVGRFKQQQTVAIETMQKTSLASKAASVGVGLLSAALSSIVTLAVVSTIQALITKIDELLHQEEIWLEKTQELKEKHEELESEIASLTSELDNLNKQIDELEDKDHLTLTEQSDLENLRNQRLELEQTLAVQRQLNEEAKKAESDAAINYFKSNNIIDNTFGLMGEQTSLESQIQTSTRVLEQMKERFGENSDVAQSAQKDLDELTAKFKENDQAIQENIKNIMLQAESLSDDSDAAKMLKDSINDLYTAYLMDQGDIGGAYTSFLKSNDLGSLDKQLQSLAEHKELTREDILANQEFVWMLTQVGITIDEVVEHYNALAAAQQSAADAPSFDLSSAEGLKSALSDIIERLGVVNSTELNAANFDTVDGDAGDAWAELQRIMQETGMTLEEIIEKSEEFGLVSSDGISQLTDEFIEANQNTQTFSQNLSNIQTRIDALTSAYQSLSNGEKLSADIVQNLLSYYPQLESELLEYLAGLRSQSQLMADLESAYQVDLDNWRALILAKMSNNEEFYSQIITDNAAWVSEFSRQYGVDLSQCQSYAQAKIKVFQTIMDAAMAAARATAGMTNIEGPLTWEQTSGATTAALEEIERAMEELNSISMGSIEGQFGSLQSAIDSTANSARDAASAIRSIASSSLSQINGLMDMTISMLKQDLQNQLDGIDASLDAMQDNYNAQKDNIEANRDAALDSIEDQIDALRDQKDAQDDMYDAQIDALRDAQDAQDKIYEDQIDALEDELDAYNKIIDAQIEMIRLKEEQHDYENELADKQKEVADIEAQLAELGLDDSIEAQKQRLELEEELAEKKEELEEFQHDKNIEDQITALENEKKQYEEEQQAAIDRIEAEKEAYDEMISVKIEGIQKAKEAFDDSIEAEINALQDQKDRMQDYYDSQLANLQRNYEADRAAAEAQKERIQAQINDEASLRQQAIELIEGRSQEFYNRLIEWNRQYGTGIDADVTLKWNNAYAALEAFGGKQFDVLDVMNNLTVAADGFNESLRQAVEEAGNLQSALQDVLSMQSSVNRASMIDAATSHGASPGGKPTPFAKYHEGGEVGKDNTISYKQFRTYMENLKSDEIPAILQKKEWVLTEEQQGNILKLAQNQQEIIDSFTRMYSSLSSALPDNDLSSLNRTLSTNGIPEMPESVSAVSGSEPINFFISTEITGNADDSVMDDWFAKNSEAFQDRFARYTLERINYKRSLRTVR